MSVHNRHYLRSKHLIVCVFGLDLDQATQENITPNTQSKKKRVLGAFLGEYNCFALNFSSKRRCLTQSILEMCPEEEEFDFDESDKDCDDFLKAIKDEALDSEAEEASATQRTVTCTLSQTTIKLPSLGKAIAAVFQPKVKPSPLERTRVTPRSRRPPIRSPCVRPRLRSPSMHISRRLFHRSSASTSTQATAWRLSLESSFARYLCLLFVKHIIINKDFTLLPRPLRPPSACSRRCASCSGSARRACSPTSWRGASFYA